MSAIKLSTPSSGSISLSPADTASNLTITVPAVSGTMFNQGNIVGTVSESSGVPTGAIIERGSNANGEFVKYADGTMICTKSNVSVATNIATFQTLGNFYSSTFINGTSVALSISHSTDGTFANRKLITVHPNNNTTFSILYNSSGTTVANSTAALVQITAIGRWF
jgi:hypothetical protein